MLYIAILVIIVLLVRHIWSLSVLKKMLSIKSATEKLLNKSLYEFIIDLEKKIKKKNNHYWSYSSDWNSHSKIMNMYHHDMSNFILHVRKLEDLLLSNEILSQIKTWDLKMCVKVLSFINDGIRESIHSRWAKERIKKGKLDSFENDIKTIERDSYDPVKILAHPEVIGISLAYLNKVGERANELLDEMYDSGLEDRDLSKIMHAHFIKVYLDFNFINPLNKYSGNDLLYDSKFQFDLFLLKGSQVEDEHIRDPYLDFILSDELKKYIY